MLISEALILGQNNLKQKGVNSHRIDALLLLCHCLSLSKEEIIFNPGRLLTSDQESNFISLLTRRENREPISHILGRREFFGNDFIVNSNVLDPRPDSETLVEMALEIFPNRNADLKILELGVGSGCLILTILKNLPFSSGIGVDVSKAALEIAKNNATALNLLSRIEFIQSDWFEDLKIRDFDLIISNPPYIKTSEISHLQEEVKNFEPNLALDGGDDGLFCYQKIALKAKEFLKESGFVILEIGQNQESDVIEIFTNNGLEFVKDKKDLSGIIRCLTFKRA
ncbi:MAG: prmC [Rickettsiaceae bacterium]|jgi:release factor glutamine methyltransferase|nr:prmC [Rickettsiaceae bacterium]